MSSAVMYWRVRRQTLVAYCLYAGKMTITAQMKKNGLIEALDVKHFASEILRFATRCLLNNYDP